MVIFGERFDYSNTHLTKEQQRVARCRAEAARRGREQARRWRAKKAAQQHGDAPVLERRPARGVDTSHGRARPPQPDPPIVHCLMPVYSYGQPPSGEYRLGQYYTGDYCDGESFIVQFVAAELCYGDSPILQLISGQFEDDEYLGQFLLMR